MLQGEIISLQITNKKRSTDSPYPKLVCQNISVADKILKAGTLVDRLSSEIWLEKEILNLSTSLQKCSVSQPNLNSTKSVTADSATNDHGLSWHESLIEEFNQTLLPTGEEGLGEGTNKISKKRTRLQLSINNTPSAPVRSRAKVSHTPKTSDRQDPLWTTFPLSGFEIPSSQHVPVSVNRDDNAPGFTQNLMNCSVSDSTLFAHENTDISHSADIIIASTPIVRCDQRQTIHQMQIESLDPSRDLFASDNEN